MRHIKREDIQSARTPEELLPALEAKALELELFPAQEPRNPYGPVYTSDRYDLRIDKHPGREQYTLRLMHKLRVGRSLLEHFRRR